MDELRELLALGEGSFEPTLIEEIVQDISGLIVSYDVEAVTLSKMMSKHIAVPLAIELRARGVLCLLGKT